MVRRLATKAVTPTAISTTRLVLSGVEVMEASRRRKRRLPSKEGVPRHIVPKAVIGSTTLTTGLLSSGEMVALEPVSDTRHSSNEARPARFRLDLAAQVHDVDVHGALQAVIVVAEGPIQQLGAGERPAGFSR